MRVGESERAMWQCTGVSPWGAYENTAEQNADSTNDREQLRDQYCSGIDRTTTVQESIPYQSDAAFEHSSRDVRAPTSSSSSLLLDLYRTYSLRDENSCRVPF